MKYIFVSQMQTFLLLCQHETFLCLSWKDAALSYCHAAIPLLNPYTTVALLLSGPLILKGNGPPRQHTG